MLSARRFRRETGTKLSSPFLYFVRDMSSWLFTITVSHKLESGGLKKSGEECHTWQIIEANICTFKEFLTSARTNQQTDG